MLRAVLLVQLIIWVSTISAFFPWHTHEECEDDPQLCAGQRRRRGAGTNGQGVAFDLRQRTPTKRQPLADEVAQAAARARSKYSYVSERASRQHSARDQVKKDGQKYSIVTAAAPSASNAAAISQDGNDRTYFVSMKFGSSSKELYMLADTGASATWVMGSDCASAACGMHDSFAPGDSKTYQEGPKSFAIGYGSGDVEGYMVQDQVEVANIKTTLSFGVANVTSDDFKHFPFSGILGLSPKLASTDTFIQAVKKGNVLKSNIFGIYLNRNADGDNHGQIMFGDTDSTLFTGSIQYTSVPDMSNGGWAIQFDDISYDGKSSGVKGKLAYIDTGTTYIFGPVADVKALHQQIPGAKSDDDGVSYSVPCDSTKDLTIEFSGTRYTISPKDWIVGSGSKCSSNIYGHEVVPDSWLLGDSFLKHVYSVFDVDQSRIGFAKLADSSSGISSTASGASSTITPLPSGTAESAISGLSGHETPAITTAHTTSSTSSSDPPEKTDSSAASVPYVSLAALLLACAVSF